MGRIDRQGGQDHSQRHKFWSTCVGFKIRLGLHHGFCHVSHAEHVAGGGLG